MNKEINPLGLHISSEWRDRIEKAASAAGRSMNAEVMHRLELSELANASKNMSTHNDFIPAISDLNAKVQEAAALAINNERIETQLLERIGKLEQQLRLSDEWQDEIQRYSSVEVDGGTFAYQLKSEYVSDDRAHYACAHCFEVEKIVAKLQRRGRDYECQSCGRSFSFNGLASKSFGIFDEYPLYRSCP